MLLGSADDNALRKSPPVKLPRSLKCRANISEVGLFESQAMVNVPLVRGVILGAKANGSKENVTFVPDKVGVVVVISTS